MSRLVGIAVVTAYACAAESAPDPVRAAIDKLPELGAVVRGRTKVVVRGEVSPAKGVERPSRIRTSGA